MRREMTIKKQSGKVTLPATVINGSTASTSLKLKDTTYYQVGPHGDYVQESGY